MQSAEFYESVSARRTRVWSQAAFILVLAVALLVQVETILNYERSVLILALYAVLFCGAFLALMRSFGKNSKLISFNNEEFGFLSGYSKFGMFPGQRDWVCIARKDIRYFDVPDGFQESDRGQLFVSYEDGSGTVRNLIVPTKGLRNSDKERFMDFLQEFWPSYRQRWAEQLATRKRMNCNS
ncbi:hypothetical protein [Ruegeria halocynthiae]|uniref:hypothetical protein n=1 Tax=Ruegeria halocynthiae TaxID=985054 RepID=UPI0005666A1A|nr:hypothetical protein [Ruegeria halocynthiae]